MHNPKINTRGAFTVIHRHAQSRKKTELPVHMVPAEVPACVRKALIRHELQCCDPELNVNESTILNNVPINRNKVRYSSVEKM